MVLFYPMWIGPENIFSDLKREYPRSSIIGTRQKLEDFDFTAKELLFIFKDIKENLLGAIGAIELLQELRETSLS
jgi:hypothetical protein